MIYTNPYDILHSEYTKNLLPFASTIMDKTNSLVSQIRERTSLFINSYDKEKSTNVIYCIASASLNLFIQSNFTGPSVDYDFTCSIIPGPNNTEKKQLFDTITNRSISELHIDGENVHSSIRNPFFLLFTRTLLLDQPKFLYIDKKTIDYGYYLMLCLRVEFLHQKFLLHLVPTFKNSTEKLINDITSIFNLCSNSCRNNINNNEDDTVKVKITRSTDISPSKQSQICLELSIIARYYNKDIKSRHLLCHSQALLGISLKLSGKLGKRTKYQENDIAQLVVNINLNSNSESDSKSADSEPESETNLEFFIKIPFVLNIPLNSEFLLEKTNYNEEKEKENITKLSPLHLAIMLEKAFQLYNMSPFSDPMARISSLTYLERVVNTISISLEEEMKKNGNGNNNSNLLLPFIYLGALFLRSRIEFNDTHRQNRSIIQIEDIINTIQERMNYSRSQPNSILQDKDSDSMKDITLFSIKTFCEISSYLFSIDLVSFIDLSTNIADFYLKLSMYNTALKYYEKLGDTRSIIECLIKIGQKASAKNKILNILKLKDDFDIDKDMDIIENKKDSDSELLILLGDITMNDKYYHIAWNASKNRNSASQRKLGSFHRKNKNFNIAISHFETALSINSLFPETWFEKGFCYMELKDYKNSADCYVQCVQLDSDYGEAWNNLAASRLHSHNPELAFPALEQCIKLLRERWQVWDNYLSTAMILKKYSAAIKATERLLEMKGESGIYESYLIELVKIATNTNNKNMSDINIKYLESQLEKICTKHSHYKQLFIIQGLYSQILYSNKEYLKCITSLTKQCSLIKGRIDQKTDHKHKQELFVSLEEAVKSLNNILHIEENNLSKNDINNVYSVKLILSSLISLDTDADESLKKLNIKNHYDTLCKYYEKLDDNKKQLSSKLPDDISKMISMWKL